MKSLLEFSWITDPMDNDTKRYVFFLAEQLGITIYPKTKNLEDADRFPRLLYRLDCQWKLVALALETYRYKDLEIIPNDELIRELQLLVKKKLYGVSQIMDN